MVGGGLSSLEKVDGGPRASLLQGTRAGESLDHGAWRIQSELAPPDCPSPIQTRYPAHLEFDIGPHLRHLNWIGMFLLLCSRGRSCH